MFHFSDTLVILALLLLFMSSAGCDAFSYTYVMCLWRNRKFQRAQADVLIISDEDRRLMSRRSELHTQS